VANIALYGYTTSRIGTGLIRDTLVAAGHTVTILADSGLSVSTDLSAYDLILTAEASNDTLAKRDRIGAALRASVQAGRPLVHGLSEYTTGASVLTPARITTALTASSNAANEVVIGSTPHYIVQDRDPGRVTVMAAVFMVVQSTPDPPLGVLLASGDPDVVAHTGKPALYAIEAGTLDLDGAAIGARAVCYAHSYPNSGLTPEGATLIVRAVEWALGASAIPETRYLNPLGMGNRVSAVTVSTDFAWGGTGVTALLDGDRDTGGTWFGVVASGAHATFDFGAAYVVDEVRWLQTSNQTYGTWKWQGSNDGSAFVDLTTAYTIGGGRTQIRPLGSGGTPYRYLRILAVSGIGSAPTGSLREIEFRIAAPDALRPTAPTLAHESVTATGATITRTPGTDPQGDPITATRLQVGTDPTFAGGIVYDSGAGGEAPFATKAVSGLSPSTTYHYRGADYDAGGAGAWSSPASFATTFVASPPTVAIDQTGPLSREVGQTAQLTATVTGAPTPTLAWTSDDEAVATVDASGLVTTVAVGEVTITVTATNSEDSDDDSISVEVVPSVTGRYAALWDDARPYWTFARRADPTCMPGPHGKAEVSTQGGVHDPALLASLDAGAGLAFRARATVLVGGSAHWVAQSYYYGQAAVTAGVGVSGRGHGRVGEEEGADWFGFYAGIRGSVSSHTTRTTRKGSTLGLSANLVVGFLRPPGSTPGPYDILRYVPKERGLAGQEFDYLRLRQLWHWSDTAAGYWGEGTCDLARWWYPDGPPMSLCTVCDVSNQPREMWYTVELEVTQHAPGVVRVRARVVGAEDAAGNLLPPDGGDLPLPLLGGWHIDQLFGGAGTLAGPIDMGCGYAGYFCKNRHEFVNDGYALFRDLDITVLDAGDCEEVPEPPIYDPPIYEPPPPPEPPPDWDEEWVVFHDDDETPYYWASALYPWSTNPALVLGEPLGESSIDLAQGRSVIGQINVRVLDRRTDGGDQASGHLTAALPSPAGLTKLIGRRGLRRRWVVDDSDPRGGYYHVLMDGVIGGVQLESDFVTYSHPTRDIRERERKARAFGGGGTTGLLPNGVLEGFGTLLPPIEPLAGTWDEEEADRGILTVTPTLITGATYREMIGEIEWGEPVSVGADLHTPATVRFPRAMVRWRPVGTEEWTTIRAPGWTATQIQDSDLEVTQAVPSALAIGSYTDAELTEVNVTALRFGDLATPAALPDDAQEIEVVVLYAGPASEEFPVHLSGLTAGELLVRLYEGEYSDPGFRPIRYDEAAVLALTEPVLARITRPVDDLRRWTEDNVYKPLGYAPALRAPDEYSMVIWPVRLDPIDPDADLPVLDGEAVIAEDSAWSQEDASAVNVVRIVYPRYYLPALGEAGGDGIATRLVAREYLDAASVSLIGESAWEAGSEEAPLIFGSVGDPNGQMPAGADPDRAALLLIDRRDVLFATRLYGAQRWVLPCRWSAARTLQVGDEVRVRVPWWPDYATGRRGLDRVGIVVAIADPDYVRRIVTVEDAEGASGEA
jgi:hypothetical protein